MNRIFCAVAILGALATMSAAQSVRPVSEFKLALPEHAGQLSWQADGFKRLEFSAKPKKDEIGVRGEDSAGGLKLLGYLFLLPAEGAPYDSKGCQQGIIAGEQELPEAMKITAMSVLSREDGIAVALTSYTWLEGPQKRVYSVRGFVSTGDICGDLEIYSYQPIQSTDRSIQAIFESYRLEPSYVPRFDDILLYADLLAGDKHFEVAAPLFEKALAMVPDDQSSSTVRRMVTDKAGTAYRLAGNIARSRAVFEAAIAKDPEYPLYYYNLACVDAREHNLNDARTHLKQAFERRKNVTPKEAFPNPLRDDSFLPYKDDKQFWSFLETLTRLASRS